MRIVEPRFTILQCPDGDECLLHIERCCRVAYKSEDKIGDGTAEKLVRHILNQNPPHESVLEHANISVLFVTSRAIANEMTRHRICSVTQESTRYVAYDNDKHGAELSFIQPTDLAGFKDPAVLDIWMDTCEESELAYMALRRKGVKAEIARDVLPLCLKAELIVTANLRQWRHMFRLRCSKKAHPDMRRLMVPLRDELRNMIPVVFDEV